jgi:predicted nucleic acid-binding protein
MILVDTNVLLRSAQPSHSLHQSAVASVANLRLANEALCLVPQVLYEYWVVATRPVDENGLGMSARETEVDLAKLMQRFRFFRDERAIFEPWHKLVVQHQVLGKNGHDARLVAAMQRHSLTHILTFNGDHFKRYPGITVLVPQVVAIP